MAAYGWGFSGFSVFVQLTPGADPAAVAARIADIVKEAKGLPEASDSYALQPLQAIYFDTEAPNHFGPRGNTMHLALCAILAVVILTIAGFNYVNLATARAGRRIHEIGVRKALGAHRGQLMRQLLSESVLLSTAATVLGAALTEVLTPLIPVIAGANFSLPHLHWTTLDLRWGCGLGGGGWTGRGRVPGLGGGALSAGDRGTGGPRGRCAPASGFSRGAVHGYGGVNDDDAADMAPSRFLPKPPSRRLHLGRQSRNRLW